MTSQEFRRIACYLPSVMVAANVEADEVTYRGMTIGLIGLRNPGVVLIRLSPEDQHALLAKNIRGLSREPSGRGSPGTTCLELELVEAEVVRETILSACRYAATLKAKSPNRLPR